MHFRKDIQGLRALAFLLVFVFHINHNWLPGGFLGVDIFFVISGYLMTTIIVNGIESSRFNFYQFFLKRVKRIVPAYYFFVVLVAFVSLFLYSYNDIIASIKPGLLYSSFFISNILFALEDNYFGARLNENPFLHTWSLAIEMQFYLLLPVIIYLFKKHTVKVLITVGIILTVYSCYHLYLLDDKSLMYFSLLARFPEFLIGGIFSQIFKRQIDLGVVQNNILAGFSFAFLLICTYYITPQSNFPGILAALPCMAAALLLSVKKNFVSTFFSTRIPVYIGELSYSLYLWHFPLLAFIRYRYNQYDLDVFQIVLVCIFTFLLAWFSYNFVESKFRKKRDKVFYIISVPAYLLLGMLILIMPKVTLHKKIPDLYAKPPKLANTIEGDKLGDTTKSDKILLIGDSHALMFRPFLDVIGKANSFSFSTLTTSSYPALPGIKRKEIPDISLQYYKSSRDQIKNTQKLIKKNTYIILSISGVGTPQSEYYAIDSLAKALKTEQKLILINSFPQIDRSPIRLNNGFIKKSEYAFSILDNSQNYIQLKKIALANSNVYVYNMRKGKILHNPGYYNDTVAYYDRTHINIFASKKMGAELNTDFMRFFNAVRASDK